MRLKIIQERLDQYKVTSWQEEEKALKEIFQELALAGFARTDFFKKSIFQGGTALRILYTSERFSEDLDFVLKKPNKKFQLSAYLKILEAEFETYGIAMEAEDRSKVADVVQKAFLKETSLGGSLILKHFPQSGPPKKIRIKLEIDTNPPKGSQFETKYLDFPFPFAVTVQDPPSLFASKSHALLCREYVKGRDWYDFLWYVSRKTPLNFNLLTHACHQQGPWANVKIKADKKWFLEKMEEKIKGLDWKAAKKDVARFLKPNDLIILKLWGEDFFIDRLKKLGEYL